MLDDLDVVERLQVRRSLEQVELFFLGEAERTGNAKSMRRLCTTSKLFRLLASVSIWLS